MAAYCDCNKEYMWNMEIKIQTDKNKLDKRGIKIGLTLWGVCICTVWGYTVSSKLYKVTWYGRQLKKWVIIIGLLLVDHYVVPVMQVYKSNSQQSILLPLGHGFNNFSVFSAGPNSCLLSRMCVALPRWNCYFLCNVGVLCVVWLLVFRTVRHMHGCMYCIWVGKYQWG